jgi:hypothetical protein
MSESCSNCYYSRRRYQLGEDRLLCCWDTAKNVLLPPLGPQNPMPMLVALWPEVDESAWCGKWDEDPMARKQ